MTKTYTVTISRHGETLGSGHLDADGYITDYAPFAGRADSSILAVVGHEAHCSDDMSGETYLNGVRYAWSLAE